MARRLGILLLLAACAGPDEGPSPVVDDDAPSFALAPPWRLRSLPEGTFVSTAGHGGDGYFPCPGARGGGCGYDLGASRWDAGSRSYSSFRSTGGASQADRAIWGMPLYSPVDGHVVACWRSMPDDLPDRDDDTPPGCAELPGGQCMATGNHLWLRTDDDHLVLLAHLMQGSIPDHLCPIPGADPIPDTLSDAPCAIAGRLSGPVDATRLERLDPPVAYPPVARGDFLGRVGESGQASGPHLHLSVGTYEMDEDDHYCRSNVLIRWTEVSWQLRDPDRSPDEDAWRPLHEEPLPIDLETFFLLRPDA